MVKVNPGQSRIVVDAKYPEEAFPQIYQGMSEFALVSGRFSTVDLLHYLLSRIGPAYADCASWCGSFQTMRSVQDFFEDGRLLGFRMIMDGGFESARKGFCEFVNNTLGDVICLLPNHAKFTALYNDNWSLVIETSANLTKSIRTEHYRLSEDPDFCGWVVDYFDTMFELRDQKGGILRKADLFAVYR